ncbi:MAG: transcription antitermination factor NusB [Elusimicrobia bacterium]|nr:transcription antitermination factor NusB [Elusimicrobiota bacterium]
MGSRRVGREICLQTLYLWDNCGLSQEEALWAVKLENAGEDDANGEEQAPDQKSNKIHPEAMTFADQLTKGVIGDQERLDALIQRYCHNWKLSRMSVIDRNILRIGAYEILSIPEIPVNVIINEAVEIAKSYSTDESGKFVNGILDKMKRERSA